ncbi:MAG: T9SS type A sorting domain-containing protein [Bacteroidales bacterium]|nr:T9SS type A sorting domain-containing protein [Bacteroidales bacterium]
MEKLLTFLIIILLNSWLIKSQEKSQEIVASSGAYEKNSNLSVSWTLGDLAVNTESNSNIIIIQGFQQGDYVITLIGELNNPDFEVNFFPNPSKGILNLKFESCNDVTITLKLADIDGKVLKIQNFNEIIGNSLILDLSAYKNGIYLLELINDKSSRTYKIVKQ